MILRRLLDYFHLAPYPAAPKIARPAGLAFGINAHLERDRFPEIAANGFDTVLLDWSPEIDPIFYGEILFRAKDAGLKVFVTGLPKDGAIAEHARALFGRHGAMIDYLAVRNEPDLARFYDGTIKEFANDIRIVWAVKRTRAPHVKLVAPCFSNLGRSAREGWRDKEALIREITFYGIPGQFVDFIGVHLYQRTPDAATRYFHELVLAYRRAGWPQKFFVSEFGWESQASHYGGSGGGGQFWVDRRERQALYVANTLARLSHDPDVAGAAIYSLNDDPAAGEFFGVYGKPAWERVKGGAG